MFSGNSVYVPEELGADVDDEGYIIVDSNTGEVLESPAQPAEPTPTINSHADVEKINPEPGKATQEFNALDAVPAGVTASQHDSGATQNTIERPDWQNPGEAFQWSVDRGFAENIPNAVGSWNKVLKELFDTTSLKAGQESEAFDAYFVHQIAKESAE